MTENNRNEKNDIKGEKGILETIREVDRKAGKEALVRESQRQMKSTKKDEKKREVYSRQLQNDKIELIKAKQGLSEGIQEEEEGEKKKYTLWEKWCSFFYRNKPMVIFGAIAVAIVGFLTFDYLSKVEPDFTVMLLIDDQDLGETVDKLENVISEYIDDINGDGKVKVTVYYMPVSDEVDPYTMQASTAKLYAMMQQGDDMLVIADKTVDELIRPDSLLYDLSEDFPDSKYVKGYGFYFNGSGLYDDIGYSGEGSDEYYMGIRKVKNGVRYKETMQKNFDIGYGVLSALIQRYS